jgi:hypothetical protein
MTIRRQPRDAEGVGSLKLLSALDLPAAAERAIGEAKSIDEFIHRLGAGARASLNNASRMHGLRTEAMFRAVLVALGDFQLLVEEDEGQVYYDDAEGPVKLPDYRAVDSEGRQLLVEVKAIPPKPRQLHHRIPAAEVHGLRRYGELTDTAVAVAHYWSAANLWTLIDLERMRPCKGQYELGLGEAVKFNEMVRFGDRTVGTVPPLELRLEVEEVGERVRPDTATVLIKSTQLLAAGQPLEDQVERRIAFLLFRYGRWNIETPAEIDATGRITSVALLAAPPPEAQKEVERQGFAFVGALSSMYSAMFNEITLDDEGAVRQLDHHSEPGELGSLIPADYFEGSDRRLKLWVFQLQSTVQDDEASE